MHEEDQLEIELERKRRPGLKPQTQLMSGSEWIIFMKMFATLMAFTAFFYVIMDYVARTRPYEPEASAEVPTAITAEHLSG